MKKTLILFFAICANILFFSACQKTSESVQEFQLNDQWKFAIGDDLQWAAPDFDDSEWAVISSARIWEDQGYPNIDGFGWYRREISIPAELKTQIEKYGGLLVKYDNADDADEFFFNGKSIGQMGSFPPNYSGMYGQKREYIVPADCVVYDKPNVMAVRVYDGAGGGGLMSAQTTVRPRSSADAVQMQYDFPATEWVFAEGDAQQIDLTFTNTFDKRTKIDVFFTLATDKREPLDSVSVQVKLKANEEKQVSIPFALPAPGFYRCTLHFVKDGISTDVQKFNIGYEPEKIVSPRDAKPDFEAFWKNTRAELDRVKPNFKTTLMPERSTGAKNIYHVEMMSFGNVKIEGYYATPKEKGVYPAIIVYMGYGSEAFFPHTDGNPGYAEFVLSVRGQGIQKPGNKYNNDWIISGLDSKENYYYRGAFMDLVRGVDFLCSRPEVDSKRIVAEGGSQGGAFTLAACALDERLAAGAPTIPFLSDYRDYFAIVHWPRSDFDRFLENNPDRTWDEIYDILTYFDIKNLASWIQCPIIMAAGLQDEVCPPHTNFAGYNQITSEKEYRVYHDQAHETPQAWQVFRTEFFDKIVR